MSRCHLDLEGNIRPGWPQDGTPGCGCSACRRYWADTTESRARFRGAARGGLNGRKVEADLVLEIPGRQPVEGWPDFLLEPVRLTIEPGHEARGEVETASISLSRWEALRLAARLTLCALRAPRIPKRKSHLPKVQP